MTRQPGIHLRDILDSIDAIDAYVRGMTRASFEQDPKTQDAVLRRIEIIGEAAGRLMRDGFTQTQPDIPWASMKAMRNLVIHDYDSVDLGLVWNLVENRLADLRQRIAPLLPPG